MARAGFRANFRRRQNPTEVNLVVNPRVIVLKAKDFDEYKVIGWSSDAERFSICPKSQNPRDATLFHKLRLI